MAAFALLPLIRACRTPFTIDEREHDESLGRFRLQVPCVSPENHKLEEGLQAEPKYARVVFVLKDQVDNNNWYKTSDCRDFVINLRASQQQKWQGHCAHVVDQILEREVESGAWTLMHRYNLCRLLLDEWSFTNKKKKAQQQNECGDENFDFWCWIFVWQRFSFIRVLDWQRNYNTKPRELAQATNDVVRKLGELWTSSTRSRSMIRLVLTTLGRGGNQGQRIRDEILHIMHRNHIRETAGHFYEQWHQKLHNNTTPDDIGICRAVIAFLKSKGDLSSYWKVLDEHGITKERLASYERPITCEPYTLGVPEKLVTEFTGYLKILQSVHDATDARVAFDNVRIHLTKQEGDSLEQVLTAVVSCGDGSSRNSNNTLNDLHSKFIKLCSGRELLLKRSCTDDALRFDPSALVDMLFMDVALEMQQIVIIQRSYQEDRIVNLSAQMYGIINSISAQQPWNEELACICADWFDIAPQCAELKWGNSQVESALCLKGLSDRLSRAIEDEIEVLVGGLGPKADYLAKKVGVEPMPTFVDEVLRGTGYFSLSLLLKRLEGPLRKLAQLPPWQLISIGNGAINGKVTCIDKLQHLQEIVFEVPTILISGSVSGEEEIPRGVVAVLVRSAAASPDILSHVSVRARNCKVILAVCFDSELIAKIEENFTGKWATIEAGEGGEMIKMTPVVELPSSPKKIANKTSNAQKSHMKSPKKISKEGGGQEMDMTTVSECWVIPSSSFSKNCVGGKSLNLKLLADALGETSSSTVEVMTTPKAVALPYGAMQKTLNYAANRETILPKLKDALSRLDVKFPADQVNVLLNEARALVERLVLPEALYEEMKRCIASEGGESLLQLTQDKEQCWIAIKKVWASLFGMRPWVSLIKAERSYHALNMAVLVQELIDARYAFVLHTQNPFSSNTKDEVYGELVVGLGETLVGNCPGRAISFRAAAGSDPEIVSFFSKSVALKANKKSLIFRSDSNGEDLDGFAGAGLFESISSHEAEEIRLKYREVRLVNDGNYRLHLTRRLAEAGRAIEARMGSAQDIEGVVVEHDRIVIVQTRPQV